MAVYQMTGVIKGKSSIPDILSRTRVTIQLSRAEVPDGSLVDILVSSTAATSYVIGATVYLLSVTSAADLATIAGAITVTKKSKED